MKEKTKFVCGECGYETVKWMGCCPMCGSWNTLVEVSAAPEKRSTHSAGGTSSRAVTLGSVSENDTVRVTTGIGEFDRVLGGGVVVGSTVLIGGDPGIGKSTLIMQAAGNLKKTGGVIYVSGEESKAQLKLRAVRCGVDSELLIMTETSMDAVESEVDRIKPRFLVIDSIQTMMNRELNNAAGSVTQIREATTALTRIAKQNGCAIFIIGHVTKEGALAGSVESKTDQSGSVKQKKYLYIANINTPIDGRALVPNSSSAIVKSRIKMSSVSKPESIKTGSHVNAQTLNKLRISHTIETIIYLFYLL